MKKGFTLIELLIVMVIVGTLVTIALPKYQRALERGRALEGLRNAQYAAEYASAKHLATGEYPSSLPNTDQIKNRFFGAPTIDTSDGSVTISRNSSSGWNYQFITSNDSEGLVVSIRCEKGTGAEDDPCAELDLTGNLLTRK